MQKSLEIRIPARIIYKAFRENLIRELYALTIAKYYGCHRIELSTLQSKLSLSEKSIQRYVKTLTELGWAGTDGKFLFPRSWKRLGFSKKFGLYFAELPIDRKIFEVFIFVHLIKRIHRRKGSPHSQEGRVRQKDYPNRYLSKVLKISNRSLERLRARAVKEKLIYVERQYVVLGKAKYIDAFRRNLQATVFVRGSKTVSPIPSKIEFKI